MAFYNEFKWHYKEETYNNLSKMVYSKDIHVQKIDKKQLR